MRSGMGLHARDSADAPPPERPDSFVLSDYFTL
ncbi:hypothetical+protein [Methylocapsa aurea]